MRQLMIVSALLIASQVIGCGKEATVTDSVDTRDASEMRQYGYLGRSTPNSPPNGRVELSAIKINGQYQNKPLYRGNSLRSQEFILLQSLWSDGLIKNNILFGPQPGVIGQPAEMRVESSWELPGTVSVPVVQISCGWVYLTGADPQVQTEWVAAGATGSTIIMQITVDSSVSPPRPVHRFFFREGSSGFVHARRANPLISRYFNAGDADKFVDAYENNTLSELILVANNTQAQAFIASIGPHLAAMGAESMN